MTDRSSSAYLSSAFLHALVVAVVLLLGYVYSQSQPETPKIFELVAGAGDNYAATEAPALGSPGGIKLSLPKPLPPAPDPAPVPVAEVAPAPVPAKAAPAKQATIPNFASTVKRTVARVTNRVANRLDKQRAADEKKREMTLDEFRKEHPDAGSSARGIARGVAGGSIANTTGGANGKALTREQGSEMDAYWAFLYSRVKGNYAQPPDVSDALSVTVAFYLGRDGSISRVEIVHSSGSAEFDESVRQAFVNTRPALPPSFWKGDRVQLDFSLRDDSASG